MPISPDAAPASGTATGVSSQERSAPHSVHPPRVELEDFMLGRLSQRDSRNVILHLLQGCSSCREVTSVFWHLGLRERAELSDRFSYDSVMGRVFDRVRLARLGLQGERAEAGRHLAELEAHPRRDWLELARDDARFHTWGVCELVLDRARDRARSASDLAEAAGYAALAVALSGRIDTAVHPKTLVEELAARAWSTVADVRRGAGDLRGAEEALRRAESHLLHGTGDRLEKACLLERKAALRTAQGRSEEAARLLSRAILLNRRLGQWDRVGRILVELGCIRGLMQQALGQAAEQAVLAPARRGALGLLLDRMRGIGARLRR